MDQFFKKINFPYSSLRVGQDKFIKEVYNFILANKNLMVQAPTGLGKTVSALAPAIALGKRKGLTVVCLTSRQTQANQIIETIKDINNFSKLNNPSQSDLNKINYVAFIGKRNMCVHDDRDLYPPSDFNEFCKKTKEKGKCKYYKNTKNSDYAEKIKAIIDESSKIFISVENFVNFVSSPMRIGEDFIQGFCPYELAGMKAFKSDIVICDFNYMFSEGIREGFLGKIGRSLDETILVVDEAHNLPDRIRAAYSYNLTNEGLKNALSELKDFIKSSDYDAYIINLRLTLNDIYHDKLLGDQNAYLMKKEELIDKYLSKFDYQIKIKDIIEKLQEIEELVKEERVVSFVGRVATFLERWNLVDGDMFLRVLEKNIKEDKTILSCKIKCIDPSNIASEVLNNTYSSILMSGTLSPLVMYKDILGLGNVEFLELESPFKKDRQLTIVLDDVTTKYTARNLDMYKKIAKNITSILHAAIGKNAIIFFPSYAFMERVLENINLLKLDRKILKEQRYMTKELKEKFVDDFKSNGYIDNKAKVLFAITSGSFAEGLDLPSSALEMVVVVGLPLQVPDLYTKAVIAHFEKRFRKGQMYGYINPAISKIVQAAGRCIRTEQDRGVVVLMDNRFKWPLYSQFFPTHWKMKSGVDLKIEITNFFNKNTN